MKIFSIELILILWLFSGCEKTEIVQLDLKGTMKGEIYTLDEFGYKNGDNENTIIKLEGSEPLITSVTDSLGKYVISDIPSGTYNLIISKEGYGEYQVQGFQIVGGAEPLYFNSHIVEKSSTTIENLSIEIVNASEILLKGVVNHNYIINGWSHEPTIRYFIHKLDSPSDNNYLKTDKIRIKGDSGSQFQSEISIDKSIFVSGSTIYAIAYGSCFNENSYYDILSNGYRYTCLGVGSNVASITIP